MKLEAQPLGELLDALGSKSPTPGGGAVASIVTGLAAALARMVVNYSTGKKKLAKHDDLHQECLTRLAELACRALELAEEDANAYGKLNELMKLEESDETRQKQWPKAVDAAISAPQEVLSVCLGLLHLLERMLGTTNQMLASDLAIAAILAEAGAKSAAWNVRINLPLLNDPKRVTDVTAETDRLIRRAGLLREQIENGCTPG